MSTAQLIVVGYAALAVEAVLLLRALVEGSATALILAILVAAAVLIYFLKPHPMARKLVVVGATVPACPCPPAACVALPRAAASPPRTRPAAPPRALPREGR